MKVIEQFIQGKDGSLETCEDGIFIGESFIAVVDGVTAKGKKLWGEKQRASGAYAKDVLLGAFGTMRHDIDAEEALQYLSDSLAKEYKGVVPTDVREHLQAVLIIYSNHKKEIWLHGDCQCLVNDKYYSCNKPIDRIVSDARAMYMEALLKNGENQLEDFTVRDIGRELVQPLLDRQALFANDTCEYGYVVLNGINLNLKGLHKIKVCKGDKIVLASDGYPRVRETLAESEDYLQGVIERDPLCFREYKSTKGLRKGNVSFDDRAFISFMVE